MNNNYRIKKMSKVCTQIYRIIKNIYKKYGKTIYQKAMITCKEHNSNN